MRRTWVGRFLVLALLLVTLAGCKNPPGEDCWEDCKQREGTLVTIMVDGEPYVQCIQVHFDRGMALIECVAVAK